MKLRQYAIFRKQNLITNSQNKVTVKYQTKRPFPNISPPLLIYIIFSTYKPSPSAFVFLHLTLFLSLS